MSNDCQTLRAYKAHTSGYLRVLASGIVWQRRAMVCSLARTQRTHAVPTEKDA